MNEKFKINVTSNYLGNFYTTFVGLFTLPIYLEYLGVEAYGLIGFFTMLMAFIMLLDMGFSATFLREVPYLKEEIDGYKEIRKLTKSMEIIFIIISLLILVIFFSFNDYISTEWLNVKVLSINTVQVAINLIAILLVFMLAARHAANPFTNTCLQTTITFNLSTIQPSLGERNACVFPLNLIIQLI